MKITSTNAGVLRKKIGNTTYRISVYHSTTSKENLQDKILRLAKNDLTHGGASIKLEPPQTVRLLEGSSQK
ncbi:MAG: transposon-encoded TnpW family protein [Defluviitaleaceae bacterium]|nr:transposon-encoded TnpW family protein [Defluviitaleaceae bacterium]